jgi:hypothetical protein
MAKSRKYRSKSKKNNKKTNVFRNIQTTSKKVLPQINSGLKTVGTTVKSAAPVVEKGISGVYGALATGFDMSVKGVKTMVSKNKTRKHGKRRH